MSKSKRKLHPLKIIFYCLLFVVYILLFPQKLNHFLYFSSIENNIDKGESLVVPFLSDSKIGYFDTSGSLVQTQERLVNSSISQLGFFNYSNLLNPPTLYGVKKEEVINIDKGYWPFILNDKMLAINSESTSISNYNWDGSLKWETDYNSIITFIKRTNNGYLVGLANGTLHIYEDNKEIPILTYTPGGSNIPILLGADFSTNKNRIIVVSGLDPQRLVILEKRKSEYRPVYHSDLDTHFNREVFTKISTEGDWGFVEQDKNIIVVDMKSYKISRLPFSGNIKDMRYNARWNLFEILSYDENNIIELSYYTNNFVKIGSLKQQVVGFFYDNINDVQYWGSNESIGRMILSGN